MRSFNYLVLLSLVGLLGLVGFIDASYRGLYNFFAYFLYVGYFWVRPDELFWNHVGKASTWAFVITFLLMSSWLALYYLLGATETFLVTGFWVGYWSLHIIFNGVLRFIEYRESYVTWKQS